jgi:hypothetical protein
MTAFLDFHAFAVARGDGLHPKLRLFFGRAATSPVFDVAVRPDGFLQSGPDPVSETARNRVNVSIFPQISVPLIDEPNRNPETAADSPVASGEMTP